LDCEDTRLLAEALRDSGWAVDWGQDITIGPRRAGDGAVTVDLGNSGTGSRFALALLAAVPGRFVVDGTPRLRERPMLPLLEALQDLGARVRSPSGGLPVEVDGRRLDGGSLRFAPGVSSQFVSALLLVAPLMRQGLDLEIDGPVPSRPYLDLTEDVLRSFGAEVERDHELATWRVRAGSLGPIRYAVEGDWSAAAFFLAAVAVAGGDLWVGPLRADSRQGDRRIVDVLAAAGLSIVADGGGLRVGGGPVSGPIGADLGDAPDMFPALAVVAACGPPGSVLTGLDNLRHKESNRLAVMVDNLSRLGAGIEVAGNAVTFSRRLARGRADRIPVTAAADHRVAMAMAVAALAAGPLVLDDSSCVGKSFPGFWQEWAAVLGS
jgi:3-phosphoshikimate 1-carboxyvinyltransferase